MTGAVAGQPLADPHAIVAWLHPTPGTVGGAVALALLCLVPRAWQLLRNRHYVQRLPPRTSRDREAGPVPELGRPPDDLRPHLIGAALTYAIAPVALAAAVVDLAVRGHVRPHPLPGQPPARPASWRLVRLPAGGTDLLGYERTVLRALFVDADEVPLTEALSTLGRALPRICDEFDADVRGRRWYREGGRDRWARILGWALILGGAAATGLLGWRTGLAVLGLGPVVGGALLRSLALEVKVPSGWDRATLRRMRDLRESMVAVAARDPVPDDDAQRLSRYLPYSMVFGMTDSWAGVSEATGSSGATDREAVPAAFAGVVVEALRGGKQWQAGQAERVNWQLLGQPRRRGRSTSGGADGYSADSGSSSSDNYPYTSVDYSDHGGHHHHSGSGHDGSLGAGHGW